MAEIFNWSIAANSNNNAPPNGFPENMNYSDVNNAAREVMAVMARWYQASSGVLATTGSSNAYVLTPEQTFVSADRDPGVSFTFRAHQSNTGSATLNVKNTGEAFIADAGGTDVPAGAIQSGGAYTVVWDGSKWRLLGGSGTTTSSGGGGGDASTLNTRSGSYYLNAGNFTGTLSTSVSVPASTLTGLITDARIPNLSASKITTGQFTAARIPNLDAGKITTGTIDAARLPSGSGGGSFTLTKAAVDALNADSARLVQSNSATTSNLVISGGALQFRSSNAEVFRVAANGHGHFDNDVTAFSSTVSDRRLKKNIEAMDTDECLQAVLNMKPSTFEFKKDRPGRFIGFIAQDVQAALPGGVKEMKGGLQPDGTLMIDDMAVQSVTVGAVKALYDRIARLEELLAV